MHAHIYTWIDYIHMYVYIYAYIYAIIFPESYIKPQVLREAGRCRGSSKNELEFSQIEKKEDSATKGVTADESGPELRAQRLEIDSHMVDREVAQGINSRRPVLNISTTQRHPSGMEKWESEAGSALGSSAHGEKPQLAGILLQGQRSGSGRWADGRVSGVFAWQA